VSAVCTQATHSYRKRSTAVRTLPTAVPSGRRQHPGDSPGRDCDVTNGYSREQADGLLAADPGMIASFSRALIEGLRAQQPDAEFNRILDRSITSIQAASAA
jgi:fructose-bisphosphate aldolase class 1